jgi:hypothetical protein
MFRSDIEDTVWEIMLCVCCGSQVPIFLLSSMCMVSCYISVMSWSIQRLVLYCFSLLYVRLFKTISV